MAEPLPVVFDTNIYLAAFLRPGLSEELLSQAKRGNFTVITSPYILEEIEEKLIEKKFDPDKIAEFLSLIHTFVTVVHPKIVPSVITQDVDDNHILACAIEAKVTVIISLDKHLLTISPWEKIAILHPNTFRWIV